MKHRWLNSRTTLFRTLIVSWFLTNASVLSAQDESESRFYVATGIELAWQFAHYQNDTRPDDQIFRFSPINIQSLVAYDAKHVDYFSGLTLRNYGFILPGTDPIDRVRFRTYNLGIPLGVRVGDRLFAVYGGYEIEFPLHYKQRVSSSDETLEGTEKEWFSDRVPSVAHSFFLGFQVFTGINLKIKYYTSPFFAKDNDDPLASSVDVNVVQFSLSFFLLRNTGFYHKKQE